jgi:anti-anti-sigma factor
MDDFECTVVAYDGGHLVTIAGEVDLATAPQLADVLTECADGDVRLDLSSVTFMDSSGLRTLLVTHRSFRERGRRLVICGPVDRVVHRTMEITGAAEVLTFGDVGNRNRPSGDGAPRCAA